MAYFGTDKGVPATEREARQMSLWRSGGFLMVNLANFLDGICYFGMVPLLIPYLQQHLGLDDVNAGRVFSYYVGLVTLLMFPGGALCDRLGSRKALWLALLLVASGRSLLLLAADLPQMLGALTLMATGTGIVQPSVYAAVKEYTEEAEAASGFSWLYAIMNLGSVVWFFLSPSVRAWGGIDGVYLVLTLLTWLNLGVQLLGFRHAPLREPQSRERNKVSLQLLSWQFLALIWVLIPVRNLVAHLTCTMPTVVQRAYPWAYPQLEYGFALNNLLLFAATPVLTHWTRHLPVPGLMMAGSLLSALSVGWLLLPPATLYLLLFVIMFSLGEAVWLSRFYEYVARLAPEGQVGAAMSWANFPWFIAKTTAGLYSGWMLQRFVPAQGDMHPEGLWAVYGGIALLTPLGLWFMRGRRPA